MNIRKIVYSIDNIHVLTFSQNYREIVAPFFDYQGIEYAVDNENTIHESIRLVFKNEGFVMQFRKDGATLVFEGDVAIIKKSNPVSDIFFQIYELIKKMEGYNKITRHKMLVNFVDIDKKEKIEKLLEKNQFLTNPFGKLTEFGINFDFENDGKKKTLKFGNFNEADILKFDLSPLKTEHNKDLKGNLGTIAISSVQEETTAVSFNKFRNLLDENEKTIEQFKKTYGEIK